MANETLAKAKEAKNDEFYTQYYDIEREVEAYLEYNPDVFRGKTVLLPCDDPEWSNFTLYFAQNFESLGLKKLISTSYAPDSKKYKYPIQLTLFETSAPQYDAVKAKTNGKIFVLTRDKTGDGHIDHDDLEWDYLEGDGDFRSEEVTKLRDEADIIVTNPPFSLFKEFFAWIMESGKQFIMIGNKNCVTVKEIFPYFKDNKIWSGRKEWAGGMWFRTMNKDDVDKVVNGVNMKNVPSIWLTNLDHGRRHEPLQLMTMDDNLKYSKHKNIRGKKTYDHYDNYDAIEVPHTDAIPLDYNGVMGVPISFLDKYCPEQFEILGLTQFGCHDGFPDSRKYNDYKEYRTVDNKETGASGTKTNENAVIVGKGEKKTYYMNAEGRIVHSEYKRLFIRKKQ